MYSKGVRGSLIINQETPESGLGFEGGSEKKQEEGGEKQNTTAAKEEGSKPPDRQ